MDAILQLPLDMPAHDAAPLQPVPATTVTEWPVGTFVENLCDLGDGTFVVSVLSEARLDRVWPDSGRCEPWVQLPMPPTGLVRLGDRLLVCVGVPDQAPATLWQVDIQSAQARQLFVVNDAQFLNGMAALDANTLLVNDAALGCIFRLDLAGRSASVWLRHDSLTRSPKAMFLPGANGLKVWHGQAYVTSNSRALLCRIPVQADGTAGALSVIAERLRGDDLALDTEGRLYIATHVSHTLDRLTPGGDRISLGGVGQGLAGSTACAFGSTPSDRRSLYVTTTGGIFGPPGGVLQPARLVRLEVDAEGAL